MVFQKFCLLALLSILLYVMVLDPWQSSVIEDDVSVANDGLSFLWIMMSFCKESADSGAFAIILNHLVLTHGFSDNLLC